MMCILHSRKIEGLHITILIYRRGLKSAQEGMIFPARGLQLTSRSEGRRTVVYVIPANNMKESKFLNGNSLANASKILKDVSELLLNFVNLVF